MGAPGDAPAPWARSFVDWLAATLARPAATPAEVASRAAALLDVERAAPHFRKAHPREEHLTPLFVAAGAADGGGGGGLAAVAADGSPSSSAPAPGFRATLVTDGWALGTMSLASFRFD